MFSIFKKNGERPKIVGALAEQQFSKAAKLVVADSVPVSVKNDYDYWKNK